MPRVFQRFASFGVSATASFASLTARSGSRFLGSASWAKAQADYTKAVLASIPGRSALLRRIAELDNSGVQVRSLQAYGGRYFYLKAMPSDTDRSPVIERLQRRFSRVLAVETLPTSEALAKRYGCPPVYVRPIQANVSPKLDLLSLDEDAS